MLDEDLYKYFKIESRELVGSLTRDILELEKDGPREDLLRSLSRGAHTLKGAARVVQLPEIAEIAHAMEDVLAEFHGSATAMPKDCIGRLLGQVDKISERVNTLDAASGQDAPVPASAIEPFERVRVDLSEMDALLNGVSETAVHLNGLRIGIEALQEVEIQLDALEGEQTFGASGGTREGSSATWQDTLEKLRLTLQGARRDLSMRTDASELEISQVRGNLDRLRLLPASMLFPTLERVAYDAAEMLGKRVEIETTGGDQRLESHVLAGLGEALQHLVRNAVAHGIENPDDRVANGKAAAGKVRIQIGRSAERLVFSCIDDGRGIDVDAVGRVAAERGLMSAATVPSAEEASELIFKPGVTTSTSVNQVAGRGIGLDVVREVTRRLRGKVAVSSQPGSGTTVEIELPLSLSSVRAIQLAAGAMLVWVPMEAVRSALWLEPGSTTTAAGRQSLIFEGRSIPALKLAVSLGCQVGPDLRARVALILQSGTEMLGVGVDRVIRAEWVLLHPLPPAVGQSSLVTGASFDAQGTPQLMLNPQALFEAARTAIVSDDLDKSAPWILVIDDSFSSRMLEQGILEAAGYQVELAVTAEDALLKARERRYSLFVCDVEMPGLNGFEFVALTREHDYLIGIPSILVTTRGGAEDRRHGAEVGARAYVVKGEFSDESLVETVRSVIG
jgi:two-component system, chemotaxis family, sensor kinase CheA